MGDKVSARRVAEQAKAPLVPGTVEPLAGPEAAVAFGDRHGYPWPSRRPSAAAAGA
jgi:acetyl-CoA/propionyl-CoA carboxylase biotin carboxyl carrier protein